MIYYHFTRCAMAYLNLTLFGGFEAALTSGTAVSLPTKKAQALLTYCALQPGQAHQREKLAALLWGDSEEANARNSLRQTLFVLRSALRGSLSRTLRIGGDTIGTDPLAIEVDALLFQRLAAAGTPQALEHAAALYRGDLLEGFVVDEEPFEQWLLRERERLREMALEVLARLVRCQDALGRRQAAVQTAQRLLALEPLQEAVHRVLMRLHAQAGRRKAALRQYETCVDLLRHELRLDPEPETQRLHDDIVNGRIPLAPPPIEAAGPPAPMVAFETGAATGAGFLEPGPSAGLSSREAYLAQQVRAQALCERSRRLVLHTIERNSSLLRTIRANVQELRTSREQMRHAIASLKEIASLEAEHSPLG